MPDLRPPRLDTSERATLLAFLDYVRDCVIAKTTELPDEAARHPGVDSGTSLLGLVKHLTASEVYWFEWMFHGDDLPRVNFTMELAPSETAQTLIPAYRAAIGRANAVVEAAADLDQLTARPVHGDEHRSLRWVLVHLIEETARHAGHADIIREQLDGRTGR